MGLGVKLNEKTGKEFAKFINNEHPDVNKWGIKTRKRKL